MRGCLLELTAVAPMHDQLNLQSAVQNGGNFSALRPATRGCGTELCMYVFSTKKNLTELSSAPNSVHYWTITRRRPEAGKGGIEPSSNGKRWGQKEKDLGCCSAAARAA